ncbi:MAG: PKD domain-containing protein, partial [Candidatus Micrarchaeia archaeon]
INVNPHSSTSYVSPEGVTYTVSVCDTSPGTSTTAKYAKVKVAASGTTPLPATCVDSDGGKNIYVKGTVTTSAGSWTDFCVTKAADGTYYNNAQSCTGSNCYINELYCNNGIGAYPSITQCANGCSNGACNSGNNQNGLSLKTWAALDGSSGLYMLYANVGVNGNVPANGDVKVSATVKTPSGETISNIMGPNGLNAGVYVMSFGTSMPCGVYQYKITAQKINTQPTATSAASDSATDSGSFVLPTPYCTQSTNLPPVITGASGPASIATGTTGTWKVSAYDPDGTYLSYYVNWGESGSAVPSASDSAGSTATFQHTYYSTGTYTVTFSVTDSAGATTQSTVTVKVGTGNTNTSSNLPIISKTSGPTSLSTSQSGTWSISAYDPNSRALTYSVTWGDGNNAVPSASDSAALAPTFQHSYSSAGIYPITFSVKNSEGVTVYKSTAVTVGNPGKAILGRVSYWYGKVNRHSNLNGEWSTDPDGVSGANLDILTYCKKWFSGTTEIVDGGTETSYGWKDRGNVNDYVSSKPTYLCIAGKETQSDGKVSVTADVTPAEVAQYSQVYVTGKITYANAAQDADQKFKVVTSLSSANDVASDSSTTKKTSQAQERVDYITLSPGTSKEVSAYFTAYTLGANYAEIDVYQYTSDCITAVASANPQCIDGYKLVASAADKVVVKAAGTPPQNDTVKIVLAKGWNMISSPSTSAVSIKDIASKCDISANAWSYDTSKNQYVAASYIGGTAGFWLRANEKCEYEVASPYADSFSANLRAGWNMIGGIGTSVLLSDYIGDCKVTSGPWNYSPSASQYVYSSKLEPGKGYWVKVNADCTLGGDSMPPSPPSSQPSATSAAKVATTQAN